jgi:predicted P-loop ATPase
MSTVISYYPNIRATRNGKDMPVDGFLQYIQDGKWQDQVLAIRTGRSTKDQLPYVTLSGKFNERKISGLIKHSGYLCMDIDDVDDPEMLKSLLCVDKYVYAAFVSVSGKGLAVLFKINPEKHAEAFEGLAQYLFETYEVIIDPSCKDVSRPRYVSYDPHIYLNQHADKFALYPPKPPKALTKIPDVVYVQSDFDQIIRELVARRIDITGDYHTWLRIGFALADKFGENGRDYWHSVSQFSSAYQPKTADRQYTNCLKAKKSGITIATFYYYAKQAGIQVASEQTKLITTTAALAKKGRRTKEDTVKLLQEAEGIKPQDAEDIINQVFQNNVSVPSDDNAVEALELWLRQYYDLRRNIITRYVENRGRQLQAKDFNTIYISAKKVFEKCTYELIERVINSDFTPDYNPLLDFFATHQHRKPKGVIRALFKTIDTDTGLQAGEFFPDFAEYFGTRWLVGLISSIHGTHSPLMLVLSGSRQNTGKTEWWRRLLPKELRAYYAESKLDAGKDDDILMTQKMLIMDDEMGGKSKKDEKRLKELLSKQTFSLREPYGRNNVDLQRLAVLGGTSNENELLSDPTGNRRIIPINVLSIDQEAFNKIDKIDVLMEAYHLYKDGFKWELTGNDVRILNSSTSYFEQSSAEYDLLCRGFHVPKSANDIESCFMTATEIKSHLELRSGQKLNHIRLGMELKKAGYERVIKKLHGQPTRGYLVVKVDSVASR